MERSSPSAGEEFPNPAVEPPGKGDRLPAIGGAIQRAATKIAATRQRLRWIFWSMATLDVLAFVVGMAYDFLGWGFFPPWLLRGAAWVVFTGTPMLLIAMPFIFPSPSVYRWLLRRRIRRDLKELPREQQAEVLLPLRAHPDSDTRKLVQPLIRELGAPTELTPAPTPTGRGDEPTP
jgi:hypothetical protein